MVKSLSSCTFSPPTLDRNAVGACGDRRRRHLALSHATAPAGNAAGNLPQAVSDKVKTAVPETALLRIQEGYTCRMLIPASLTSLFDIAAEKNPTSRRENNHRRITPTAASESRLLQPRPPAGTARCNAVNTLLTRSAEIDEQLDHAPPVSTRMLIAKSDVMTSGAYWLAGLLGFSQQRSSKNPAMRPR